MIAAAALVLVCAWKGSKDRRFDIVKAEHYADDIGRTGYVVELQSNLATVYERLHTGEQAEFLRKLGVHFAIASNMAQKLGITSETGSDELLLRFESGWPMRVCYWDAVVRTSQSGAVDVVVVNGAEYGAGSFELTAVGRGGECKTYKDAVARDVFPLGVLPLRCATSWLTVAMGMLIVVEGSRAGYKRGRAYVRKRLGQCPRCGYPNEAGQRCPECGFA